MSNDRFDNLTRSLSATTDRRSLVKRMGAAALAGALGLFAISTASATSVKTACARVGQSGQTCCPHLVKDVDGTCRVPAGGSCIATTDCMSGYTCTPALNGLGATCQAI